MNPKPQPHTRYVTFASDKDVRKALKRDRDVMIK